MSEVWFLDDRNMNRLTLEREALEQLQETVHWLKGIHWKCYGQLSVEAILNIEATDYEMQMIYPDLFPYVPPSVYPKDKEVRWSSHQYGAGGPLCLEWRPDTWSPEVTGAQVLESAYQLLYIEQSSDNSPYQIPPLDHELTFGQELRNSFGRLYTPSNLIDCLSKVPINTQGAFNFSTHQQSQSLLVLIHDIWTSENQLWQDNVIADEMTCSSKNSRLSSGQFFITSLGEQVIKDIHNLKDIENVIHQVTGTQISRRPSELENSIRITLLMDSIKQIYAFMWLHKSNKIYPLKLICSQHNQHNPRIPVNFQNLSYRSVGIIGLGSVGSKVAISLARTGIKKFYLVDDDIFLPENISRNALDWRNVGEHKIHAIKQSLAYLSRDVTIDCSVLNIGGQESSAFLNRTLRKISQCDLIIDATANSTVFNLLALLSIQYKKPLVWVEVFAGGIGGIIARSRPNQDPSPYEMKAAYTQFTFSHPFSNNIQVEDYGLTDREGKSLTAIDAEVDIIAGHATQFAIDTILETQSSIYPYSMYLIGLKPAWVFDYPFDTIPIDVEHKRNEKKEVSTTSDTISDNLDFLSKLLEDVRNESASA